MPYRYTTDELLKAVTLEGYAITSKFHQDGCKGGRIALVYNKVSVMLMETISFEFREAECSLFKVRIDQKQLDLCLLYRYLEGSVLTFFEDLSNVIDRTVITSNELLILGDFNIKADLCDTVEALTFSDFIDLFNLKNHVNFPTHNRGHTLDLVLSDNTSTTIVKVTQGDFISDHCLTNCELNTTKFKEETQWRYCCNIKKMDKEQFQEDLSTSLPLINQEQSVDAKINQCGPVCSPGS